MRHNNMHFLPVPPFLQNLSTVEKSMVARIIPVMRIRRLAKGMLSSTGLCTGLMNDMLAIATELPRLGSELSILVLTKRVAHGGVATIKAFHASRSKVQAALEGLCFGEPVGGLQVEPLGEVAW